MLSPRQDGQPRATLSNFGCFIPRPSPNDQTSFAAAMLSPRFMAAEKQQKPPNAMRKALNSRGGVFKEQDGYEVFYGVEPKSTRTRRRTATGTSATVPGAAVPPARAHGDSAFLPAARTVAEAAPQVATSETASAQPSAAGKTDPSQRRPGVPRLQLGGGAHKKEATNEGTPSVAQRARRPTAPTSQSASRDGKMHSSASESQDPIAAVSSFFSAVVAAVDSGAAAFDAAMSPRLQPRAVSSTAPVGPPAGFSMFSPRSLRPPWAPQPGAAPQPVAVEIPRFSPRAEVRKSDAERLQTPRGVPVYSIAVSPQKPVLELPKGVESYSLVSPTNSPSPSFAPPAASEPIGQLTQEATGEVALAPRSVVPLISEGGELNTEAAPRQNNLGSALAARTAIPMLKLPAK